MPCYVVEYSLYYQHIVRVGLRAGSLQAAEDKAQRAFDNGTLWDDTRAMPLLYDAFEERDDNVLEFTAEQVLDLPARDSSVESIHQRGALEELLELARRIESGYYAASKDARDFARKAIAKADHRPNGGRGNLTPPRNNESLAVPA